MIYPRLSDRRMSISSVNVHIYAAGRNILKQSS
jgi:hypothetical protein